MARDEARPQVRGAVKLGGRGTESRGSTDIQNPEFTVGILGPSPPITANNAVGYQLKPCANYSDKRGLTRGFLSFSFHQNPFGIKKVEALSSWCLPTVNNSSYNCFVRLWGIMDAFLNNHTVFRKRFAPMPISRVWPGFVLI